MRTPLFSALMIALAAATPLGLAAATTSSTLEFSAHPFDTSRGTPAPPAPFSLRAPAGAALHIVQFTGPVRQAWLDALSARGLVPVQYVANYGYVVWADDAARARLTELRRTANWLQYDAPFYGFLKVEPQLAGACRVECRRRNRHHGAGLRTRGRRGDRNVRRKQRRAARSAAGAARSWNRELRMGADP